MTLEQARVYGRRLGLALKWVIENPGHAGLTFLCTLTLALATINDFAYLAGRSDELSHRDTFLYWVMIYVLWRLR